VSAGLADMMLRIEFDAKLGDQVKLGFKEVDVIFLRLHVGARAGATASRRKARENRGERLMPPPG